VTEAEASIAQASPPGRNSVLKTEREVMVRSAPGKPVLVIVILVVMTVSAVCVIARRTPPPSPVAAAGAVHSRCSWVEPFRPQEAAMPGRRPLTPDQHARIALGARAGVLAIDVVKGQAAAERAVAELALIVPGRPDLVDESMAVVERGREVRLADWPPSATTLMLLGRAKRVTLGRVKLVGPNGVSVEQVTVVWNDGNPPRQVLRLRRHGRFVGDDRTVQELARHVDVATLVEELPPLGER
jgi:hypothetical protein